MYKVNLSELIPEGAKDEKIIVKFSANGNIGTISVNGGISVTSSGNWADLDASNNINSSSGTSEFDLKSIQNTIDRSGIFQFGYWWGDQTLNIDSVTCIYTNEQAVVTTVATTKATTTSATTSKTTAKTTAKTTSATQATAATQPTGNIDWSRVKYGDVDVDGKITATDAVILSKYLLSQSEYPITDPTALENADTVYDGELNNKDLIALCNVILGIYSANDIGK